MNSESIEERQKAEIAFSSAKYSDAILHFEKAIELGDNDPNLFATLSGAYFKIGKFDLAKATAKRALEVAKESKQQPVLAYFVLIDCCMLEYDSNSIINYANEALQLVTLAPERALSIAYRGIGYLYMGKFDLALTDFNEALKLDASDLLALEFRGALYYRLKKYEEALQDFQNVIKQNPQNSFVSAKISELEKLLGLSKGKESTGTSTGEYRIFYLKGRDFEKKGDYINALENYRKAYELDNNNMGIYEGLSYSSYRLYDYTYAKKYLDEAISKNLTSPYIYNTYGLVLSSEKNYSKAIEYFNKAIAANDKSTNFFSNRAAAFFNLKKYEEALADIDAALKLDAGNYVALLYLAKISVANNKKEQAIASLKKILEKYPKDQVAKDMLMDLTGIMLTEGDAKRGLTDFELPIIPKENFTNVAGMEKLKETLRESIIYPLLDPELAKEYGISGGGGILLYGPPGCGKTFIMKATAGEAKVHFINAKLSDLLDMWIGNSEKNIHNLFELARKNAPCILFFDEIDALGGSREISAFNVTSRQVVNSILTELDGAASSNNGILMVGATNAPWIVDNAIKRPGRLGNLIYVPAPDKASREALFRLYLSGKPLEANINYEKLASLTNLCNCADIAAICKESAKIPWAEAVKTGKKRNISEEDVVKVISEHKKSLPEWYESAKNTISKSGDAEGLYKEMFEAISNYEKSKEGSANYYA
jgi:ATP-dependent 26S proteasome regulatory subunit